MRALAEAQKAHPDLVLTPDKVGLQPYVTTEIVGAVEGGDAAVPDAVGGEAGYEAGGG